MAQTDKSARKRVIVRMGAVVVVGLLLALLAPAAHLYIDLLWFRSVGFESVFSTILWTQVALAGITGLFAAASVYVALRFAVHATRDFEGVVLQDPTGTRRIPVAPMVARAPLPVALFVGAIAAIAARSHWDTWLQYVHGSDFGVRDPVFGHDVGFYMFDVPALEAASGLLMGLLIASLVFSGIIHFLRGGLALAGRGVHAELPTRIHMSVLVALVLLVLGFDAWLARFDLLYSDMGPVHGASFADVNARLPALNVHIAAAVVAAVLVAISATRKRMALLVAGIALYAAVELVGVQLYPAMVHRFSVLPNEAQKEEPYITRNIAATRAAFGLDRVVERELTGVTQLTREDIDNNRPTIDNIRLWDHDQLLNTFAQIQEIRTYYEFVAVDNDRYRIDGELRQTMLSPRELNPASLPSRNWINEHFTFTHGYGLTLGPVNTATAEGLPELMIQDIPPVSAIDNLAVSRPEIYFGELANEYALTGTDNPEFDYPVGNERVYTEYAGNDGIRLDSSVTVAAAAIHLGALKLVLSDDVDSDSRLLLRRQIRERAQAIAPFLHIDSDPYMVVREDGTLAWIQDAYTTSNRYPYAQRYGGINYIRNSVKVIIDAYHGTVDLYVNDPNDPVLATWRRIFPGLFTPIDEMPADLRTHLRYPNEIFTVQTQVFTTYHMNDPELLYQREDQWEVPSVRRAGEGTGRMEPYYTIMRLPEESEAEFIQMLPFTPEGKQNLAAWMVGRSDGEHLGDLVVYRFPKDRLVFGPQQIMNRIDQDEVISRQISLWDQRGSQAILGTLLVIPVEESLLYVSPLYLKAEGGQIPELKRVIVVYENQITMTETLDGAMDVLFGPAGGTPTDGAQIVVADPPASATPGDSTPPASAETPPASTTGDTAAPAELRARALHHYERAVERQRDGDWAGYGVELDALGEVLRTLAERSGQRPPATAPGAAPAAD